jgi:hypothetical protein
MLSKFVVAGLCRDGVEGAGREEAEEDESV